MGSTAAATSLGGTFVAAYLDRAQPERAGEFTGRVDFYVAASLMRKALRAYAREPLSDLPGHYVEEARRVVTHRRGSHHGRS